MSGRATGLEASSYQQSTTCQNRPMNRPIKEQKRPASNDIPVATPWRARSPGMSLLLGLYCSLIGLFIGLF
jgi:hypothetical protein